MPHRNKPLPRPGEVPDCLFNIVILAPDFESLRATLPQFMEKAMEDKAFQVVDVDLKFNKPELRIDIDRDRAKDNGGNSIRDIAENLSLYFSQQRYGYFILRDKQYQVIGEASRSNRDNPLDLSSIYVRNSAGKLIQLENVLKISNQSNPPTIFRFNRYVSATVSAQPATGITLEGVARVCFDRGGYLYHGRVKALADGARAGGLAILGGRRARPG